MLNDVGTLIPKASMERIAAYVGKDPRFKTFEETEAYVRKVSAPFGPLTDAQWRHLTEHNSKQHEDGSWGMNYDPGIGLPFQKGPLADIDLTGYYDSRRLPHAAAARRGVGPAAPRHRARHDAARTETQAGGIRRRRPRADADGGRSDQGGAGFSAGMTIGGEARKI